MTLRWSLGAAALAGLTMWVLPASAAPRHNACEDAGDSFFFGVSSYGDLRDWAGDANDQGADFQMTYVYILNGGMSDPDAFENYYVRPFAEAAISIGATPVFTFYQLLDIGRAAGISGNEQQIVQNTLQDDAAMKTYFDNFVWLLKIAETLDQPALFQMEPDSWGFMIWAFGVEGNADATSVPVSVASSGHPDLADFPDHAGGFGQALLALRDKYAPSARMGWHASNFRSGSGGDVVAEFYSSMGEWDVIVSEEPHVAGGNWWEPWPEANVNTNVEWMKTITASAQIPMLLWQMPIGFEGQLLNPDLTPTNVERFADAGVVGLLFEHVPHNGENDLDSIRADGDAGAAPPADAITDGTAGGMRAQMIAYATAPQAWPAGSICAGDGSGSGSGGASGEAGAANGGNDASAGGGSGGTLGSGNNADGGVNNPGRGGSNPGAGGADATGGSDSLSGGGNNARSGSSATSAGSPSSGQGAQSSTAGSNGSPAGGSSSGMVTMDTVSDSGSCALTGPGNSGGPTAWYYGAALTLVGCGALRRRRRGPLPERRCRSAVGRSAVGRSAVAGSGRAS